MKRVFTFGCSFTEFPWPTWADIVIAHAESEGAWGENWGKCGGGNLFIASRIWECHAKHKFTPDDYIFVCWSSINREDRYIDNDWRLSGLMNEHIFKREFIEKHTSNKFGALRDCTLIKSTQLGLRQLGVTYTDFSMIGLIQEKAWFPFFTGDESDAVVKAHDIKFDGKPMMEVLDLKNQSPEKGKTRVQTYWPKSNPSPEWHPTPLEHQQYLEQEIISKVDFLNNGINQAGKDLVTQYMNKIKSYNGNPIKLDASEIGWIAKQKTKRW